MLYVLCVSIFFCIVKPLCTVLGQDDSDVLLAEGADSEQHGRPLGGDKAEGDVLSGPAAALGGHAGGVRASVLHH